LAEPDYKDARCRTDEPLHASHVVPRLSHMGRNPSAGTRRG
jgi:hypothetical protein